MIGSPDSWNSDLGIRQQVWFAPEYARKATGWKPVFPIQDMQRLLLEVSWSILCLANERQPQQFLRCGCHSEASRHHDDR